MAAALVRTGSDSVEQADRRQPALLTRPRTALAISHLGLLRCKEALLLLGEFKEPA